MSSTLEDRAALLIQEVLEARTGTKEVERWTTRARRWLADYYNVNSANDPQGRPGAVPGATRWRPIDTLGNVSPDPAPEHPDEPDEGETGPPEVQL